MSEILKRFEEVLENPTPPVKFEFNAFLKEQSAEDILESTDKLFIYQPAVKIVQDILENYNVSVSALETQLSRVKEVRESIFNNHNLAKLDTELVALESSIVEKANMKNSEEYLIESTINFFNDREATFKEKLQTQITLESYQESGPSILTLNTISASLESKFSAELIGLCKVENEKEFLNVMESLMLLASEIESIHQDKLVLEGVKDTAKKAAIKGDEVSRKVYNKARKAGSSAGQVGTIVKKSTDRFGLLVTDTIDKVRTMDEDAKRREVIQGGFRKKIMKFMRVAVTTGALYLFSPIVAGIHLIVSVALNARTEKRVKDALITDLETELAVIKEKVRDADSNNDKKAKYRLMRLEALVEKEIYRIKTGNRNIKPLNHKELQR